LIDLFSLALCHALLLLTGWRLLRRTDLDGEKPATPDAAPPAAPARNGWGVRRA